MVEGKRKNNPIVITDIINNMKYILKSSIVEMNFVENKIVPNIKYKEYKNGMSWFLLNKKDIVEGYYICDNYHDINAPYTLINDILQYPDYIFLNKKVYFKPFVEILYKKLFKESYPYLEHFKYVNHRTYFENQYQCLDFIEKIKSLQPQEFLELK